MLRFPIARLVSVRAAVVRTLTSLVRSIVEGPSSKYHPEDHYMRGPGPKWREKHLLNGGR